MRSSFALFSFLILFGCHLSSNNPPELTRSQQVSKRAHAFFQTFADRNDWEAFCSFYREDMFFQDILLQIELDSLWQFKRFYAWDSPDYEFEKLTPEQPHLTVVNLIANDSSAMATGHFNPFYYNGDLIDTEWGMEFTIILYFDQDLKIVKQTDWIEYDDYALEAVIERCRKFGFRAPPAWLDLSK